jgi:SRSO17 transposase
LKARNARDGWHLEIPAVQLVTPNLPDAATYEAERERGRLLIRRNIANGDLAYFTTWCPAGTSIKTLVSVEGHRWAIEDSFETAKNEFGLDHNESRSWHGWHRHVSLVMLAFSMMAAIQHQANKPAPKKTKSSATPRHPTSSVGRSRKSAA